MVLKTIVLGLALWTTASWGTTDRLREHRRIFDNCIASSARGSEIQRSDLRQVRRSREQATVPVPAHFRTALTRLTAVANVPPGMTVALYGVNSTKSAFALGTGAIFVSSALWGPEFKFDRHEAAAIVAHELAHIELSHVKDRLCHAVASAGDERLPLAAATRATHDAIWAGDTRLAIPMMQRNHARELQADRRAQELLGLAGFDPAGVGRMLAKMSRAHGSGYSELHPAMQTRIENLTAARRPAKQADRAPRPPAS